MIVRSFTFARTPKIYFGPGKFNDLGKITGEIGRRIIVVTGAHSLKLSNRWDALVQSLQENSIEYFHFSVKGEPSPDLVDTAVSEFRDKKVDVILAIGGGSVIDTGKAISAMLTQDTSVMDYLEEVGRGMVHDGNKIPFIAVPTTAGTGSEVTKNAVLSRVGADGFKKSLRHDNFVPDIAVIDPELALSCPSHVTAASGMDAFTQLLESYVSTESTPLTDALACSGIECLKDNLLLACTTGRDNIEVRAGMAYAALLSGITLANAGLGIIHGLASAIGGLFDIPHGVICGTLVGAATKVNISNLKKQRNTDDSTLKKYAKVGAILSESDSKDVDCCCELLVKRLEEWISYLGIPLLSEYGVGISDIDRIIEKTGSKNNPVRLNRDELRELLTSRILPLKN